MPKTKDEEIELLSVSAAARITHLGRDRISAAMDKYQASGGRLGLAFVLPGGGDGRRLLRRSSLRSWFEGLELRAGYGY